MNLPKLSLLAALAAACLAPQHAKALSYGQEIPAIFGSGNPSTEWVTDTGGIDNDVTVALRARERLTTNMPNDGAGLFTFAPGTSINLDFSFSSKSGSLLDYTFVLGIDNDPSGADTAIQVPTAIFSDNEFDTDAFFGLLGQNSQPFSLFGITTANPGIYNFSLTAYSSVSSRSTGGSTGFGVEVASTNIQVQVVSVPDGGATFIMLGLALLGLGLAKRKLALAC